MPLSLFTRHSPNGLPFDVKMALQGREIKRFSLRLALAFMDGFVFARVNLSGCRSSQVAVIVRPFGAAEQSPAISGAPCEYLSGAPTLPFR